MTYSHGDYLDALQAERDELVQARDALIEERDELRENVGFLEELLGAARRINEHLRAVRTRAEMNPDGVPGLCSDPGCTLCAPFR